MEALPMVARLWVRIRFRCSVYKNSTARSMLSGGLARRGDFFFWTSSNVDCRIGFFWGDSLSDNKIWQSGADDFLDRLGASRLPSVLHRAEPPEGLLYPLFHIVREVGLEPPHELLRGDTRPVSVVEELALRPAEEALTDRVVGAAVLSGHAPGHAVLPADLDPARPAVVPAPVGVDQGPGARGPRSAGL